MGSPGHGTSTKIPPLRPLTAEEQGLGFAELGFGGAPNILIMYPRWKTWWRHYRAPHRSVAVAGTPKPDVPEEQIAETKLMCAQMQAAHIRFVSKQLSEISHRKTGRLLFEEIKKSKYFISIYPFDFLPRRSWKASAGAITQYEDRLAAWEEDIPRIGQSFDGHAWSRIVPCLKCINEAKARGEHSTGHQPPGQADIYEIGVGGGSNADIYLSPHRVNGEGDDEVLMHELVHALRCMAGLWNFMPVSGGYPNLEEFLAMLMENMYRSEKPGTPLIDYNKTVFAPAKFLELPITPTPRLLLGYVRASKQHDFFEAAARLDIPFNPFKQVSAEANRAEGRN